MLEKGNCTIELQPQLSPLSKMLPELMACHCERFTRAMINQFVMFANELCPMAEPLHKHTYMSTGRAVALEPSKLNPTQGVVFSLPDGAEGADGKIRIIVSANYFEGRLSPVGAGTLMTLMALSNLNMVFYEAGLEEYQDKSAHLHYRVDEFARQLPDAALIAEALG